MRFLRSKALAFGLCLAGVSALPVHAGGAGIPSCGAAAAIAAAETGVPEPLLQAIALVESGRRQAGRTTPWPWAVNDHGKGHWFASRREAVRHVERQLAAGRTSVDVGCFQVNWRWHGTAFESVAAAFDPLTNARYAARFLAGLHEETGSWPQAVGRYHSATPHLGRAYRARVVRARQTVVTAAAEALTQARTQRPPRAAGGIALAMLEPARPLLRQPLRPLIEPAARTPGPAGHD